MRTALAVIVALASFPILWAGLMVLVGAPLIVTLGPPESEASNLLTSLALLGLIGPLSGAFSAVYLANLVVRPPSLRILHYGFAAVITVLGALVATGILLASDDRAWDLAPVVLGYLSALVGSCLGRWLARAWPNAGA